MNNAIVLVNSGIRIEVQKANKDHKCHACGFPIPKGTDHNVIYYGHGLAALKFPDRTHKVCLGDYLKRRVR